MEGGNLQNLPQNKGGFRGRRGEQKFVCTIKTGAQHKNSVTHHQFINAQAMMSSAIMHNIGPIREAIRSKASSRKTTKAEFEFPVCCAVAEQDESVQAREAESKMGECLQMYRSSCNDCVVPAQKELRLIRTDVNTLEMECTNAKAKEEVSKRIDLVAAMEAEAKVCL